MSVPEVMIDLRDHGIQLAAHGDRLRYSPKEKMTTELAERMKSHKGELLAILHRETKAPAIDLTMNVYSDPRVLDVAGALDSLPALPLVGQAAERQRNVATGTDHHRPHPPGDSDQLAPNSDKWCTSGATGDNWVEKEVCTKESSRPTKQSVSRESKRVADGIRTHDLRNHNPTF
jgi:hypothetical protein